MSLDPCLTPRIRSAAEIDRLTELFRAYWKTCPHLRFELAVNQLQPDYHYNSDEAIEAAMTRALDHPGVPWP